MHTLAADGDNWVLPDKAFRLLIPKYLVADSLCEDSGLGQLISESYRFYKDQVFRTDTSTMLYASSIKSDYIPVLRDYPDEIIIDIMHEDGTIEEWLEGKL